MPISDTKFAGSIPDLYDRHLVPLLFEPYALDLAGRVSDLRQGILLEVAAGTGAVTRVLHARLPAEVRILATDLNEGMLRVGASRVNAPSVTWQQADAQNLPFVEGSAQVIACQFGVMFVADKAASFREARRVLSQGGRFVFNVWDRLARNDASATVAEAVASMFPEDPPRFIERTPFGYHDPAVIRSELERAGFERVEIETIEKTSRATSAEDWAIGLCQGTPLRGEIEARRPNGLQDATAVATAALEARFGAVPFESRLSALVVTAWR